MRDWLPIGCVLLSIICTVHGEYENETDYEYAPYDGWYNNLANPSWGAADTELFRRLPPVYSDGTYEPSGTTRPNPIDISMAVFNGSTGTGSYLNRTAFMVFFGQQVVEEILDAQRPGCPREYFNIKVPTGHHQYDPEGTGEVEIPLLRSRYNQRTGLSPNNPRQQLNEITPYFDGTLTYGPNKAWTDAIRLFKGGRLASTNDTESGENEYMGKNFPALNDIRLPFANPPPPRDHYLKPIKRFFKIGNPRGNENPMLLTMGVMWFRYHNYKARQIEAAHPEWKDEKIFNEARKWTIATHQKIVMYDWLPAWLDQSLPVYTQYDPSVNPAIAHVFQSAAMRFGHTLVTPGVYRRNANCTYHDAISIMPGASHKGVRTCNSYWNPQETVDQYDIDDMIMGMSSQIAEAEDMIITPDLRGDVFGPLEFSRRDLMAINIQRGRDHGLPDYNTAREHFGLERIEKFEDINPNMTNNEPDVVDRLKAVYHGDIDNVDIWPAGMMETTEDGPGPLFRAIITDQFTRIRNGDRFWYENYKQNGLFNEQEVAELNATTIKDVILAVTDIEDDHIQDNPFFWYNGDPCPQPKQMTVSDMDACTPVQHYDYFKGSEVPYALTFAAAIASLIVAIFTLILLGKHHDNVVATKMALSRRQTRTKRRDTTVITAVEWMGRKEGERNVKVKMDTDKKLVTIKDEKDSLVRLVDLKLLQSKGMTTMDTVVSADKEMTMMVVKIPKEYDLILRFDSYKDRHEFQEDFKQLVNSTGMTMTDPISMSEKNIKAHSVSKRSRNQLLEKFFREIFSRAFKYKGEADVDLNEGKDVITCELTRYEFSEALGLKPNSLFVDNMFNLCDHDKNGYLSFKEFLNLIVIFSKGEPESKIKLMFDMYDLDQDGKLSTEDFKNMLKSLLELANETLPESDIDRLVDEMYKDKKLGLSSKQLITFEDFSKLMSDYKSQLSRAVINLEGSTVPEGVRNATPAPAAPSRVSNIMASYVSHADIQKHANSTKKRMSTFPASDIELEKELPMNALTKKLLPVQRYFENHRWEIFWVTLYTFVCLGIFGERAYYYSIEREHVGLRRHAGYGVTVTRGAASGMMFTYACLLVTMCRNTIVALRETFLHKFIPFDSAVSFHKIIAIYAAFFTLIHIVGHCINFYHISTQTADDLSCIFRNYYHATDELPGFTYWAWTTLTGFTGILLTILTFFMYVFATQYARRHAFRAFWITHNMHYAFWILMILHGAGRLVQPAFFHYFFLGPVILFTLDKLVSVSRKKVELSVVRSEILPSAVTQLVFRRPQNFEYKSGQWVRIACLKLGGNEYHPITLSSAPHEEYLSLHIRAVGPWTINLRNLFSEEGANEKHKLYIDGPYGEGHQDWYRYDVAVLVGGGIGVTPFASILKDLAYKSQMKQRIRCKKVYFIWVTRTQKQFEWMTDIIRDVEEKDERGLVSVHIFVTQFKEKFDIRTTMLYVCERYFQKVSNRSLLTGLQSITHFGRPDFPAFFKMLQKEHQKTNVFGVFSCGPPPMTASVEKACTEINNVITNSLFVHHSDSF